MRKIVVTEFISLDNVIEAPMWTFPYWNDDIGTFKQAELFRSDSMLLGRVTYQGFAEAWPSRTDEAGYADKFNSMRKDVVTTTLDTLEWTNSHPIKENVVDTIRALKEGEGQDILVFGSGKLVETLIQNDLVDQFNLLVYPIVLGKGQKLFTDVNDQIKLKLVEQRSYSTGVVLTVYERDRD